MKALTLTAYNEFAFGDVPVPEVGPADVLVRVKACGICGSDVHGMDGSSGRRIPPIIMGHEAAGVIEKIGPEVSRWTVGDRVTFDSTVVPPQCACTFCAEGNFNLCEHRRVLGVSCGDYRQHGAMAEFVKVPANILFQVPDALTFEQAAFAEPVSIALHAVNRVKVTPQSTAVVIGAGVIGLLIIQALKRAGCSRIIAADLSEARLDIARQTGADVTLVSNKDDVVKEVLAQTGGHGAHIAMEVVGIGPTLTLAIDCVRKGGQVGLVGNLAAKVDFPLQKIVTREISLYGSCASSGEYQTGLDAIAAGQIEIAPLLSAVAPLSEGGSWFHRLHGGKENLIKVVLNPELAV
jgi:L-iditol 2-dehydrogenase